jgi:hypothetical protein
LLYKHFETQTKKFDEYIAVCEKLGKTPNLDKLPMNRAYYPFEVQLALVIHEVLPDRWDGMSGSYMGKDWSCVDAYLTAYEVEDKRTVLMFIKALDISYSNSVNDNIQREQKKKDSQGNKFVPKATI